MTSGQSRPTRFGMIGTGWIGEATAPDFALCESVELVAIGSRDLSHGRAFAGRWGIPDVVSIDDLLARDDLDVIYVGTPRHYELARAAIDTGHGVLVEKAFTETAAQARDLAAAASANNVFLMEAMWMSFNPAIRAIVELISSGVIGEPRTVLASFGFPVPAGVDHRLWDPARAGGSLLDQGTYVISLAHLILGMPTTVTATGSRLGYDGNDSGVDSELGMLLGYEGGQQAALASSIRSVLPLSASIGGAEGSIEIAEAFWSGTTYTVRRPDGSRETFTEPKEGNGYVPMLRAVHEAVSSGLLEHPLQTVAASVAVMETIDKVRAQVGGSPA